MNRGYKREDVKGMVYYTIPSFTETELVNHLFSTRIGGISKGEYSSLNLSLSRYDDENEVHTNFKRICDAGSFNYDNMVFSAQVHGDNIRKVTKDDIGKNFGTSDIKDTDALITNIHGIPLVTFYADCTPLFFLDPLKKVIALAHAGWRGTVKEIGPKTVKSMEENYGSNKDDIIVGIGPAIGVCCYEVGEDVANEVKKVIDKEHWDMVLLLKSNGKWMLDLELTNYLELINAGIKDKNITLSGLCTSCRKDEFYSYRRDNGKTGSMAAFMEIK